MDVDDRCRDDRFKYFDSTTEFTSQANSRYIAILWLLWLAAVAYFIPLWGDGAIVCNGLKTIQAFSILAWIVREYLKRRIALLQLNSFRSSKF